MEKSEVSIIIVSYNTKKFILRCLSSIKKFAPPETEVIVVDNASTDDSVDAIGNLQFTIYNLQIIKNKENLGFAKAVNQGIKKAKGEFLFVLNADTQLTGGVVESLLEFTKAREDTGVVGPKLLSPDGSVQGSVYNEPTIFGAIKEYFLGIRGAYEKYAPKITKPVRVDAVVGAAIFIPRKTIEKVGLFDERFFLYFEDLDYCRRVRRASAGVYYLPTAQAIHEHGAAGKEIPQQTRGWLEQSARLYHGTIKYLLLIAVLWLGQKWQKAQKR